MISKGLLAKLRPSSTLIISSRINQVPINSNGYDYKVMLLKRSSKMRVAPGFHVFPGGGLDKNDQSLDHWLSVFKQPDLSSLRSLYSPLLHAKSISKLLDDNNSSALPNEISFRLCSLRETFEETGILLATRRDQLAGFKVFADLIEPKELVKWQERVKKDSSQFAIMFKELDLVPDLLALHEWANWITPIIEKVRFNTFFFTCFLPKLPSQSSLSIDQSEIESLDFWSPDETLKKHRSTEIKFIPPQLYEMNRLAKFNRIDKLATYSENRQHKGLQFWLPKFTNDVKIGLLPGDYLYEKIESDRLDMTGQELIDKYERDIKLDPSLRVNRVKRSPGVAQSSSFLEVWCNLDSDGKPNH